jgi:hypothetical protein
MLVLCRMSLVLQRMSLVLQRISSKCSTVSYYSEYIKIVEK